MSNPQKENTWSHEPLPYVIVLRMTVGDDGPAQLFEKKVTAYSLFEAVMAAAMEVSGAVNIDNANFKVEKATPDTTRFATDWLSKLFLQKPQK